MTQLVYVHGGQLFCIQQAVEHLRREADNEVDLTIEARDSALLHVDLARQQFVRYEVGVIERSHFGQHLRHEWVEGGHLRWSDAAQVLTGDEFSFQVAEGHLDANRVHGELSELLQVLHDDGVIVFISHAGGEDLSNLSWVDTVNLEADRFLGQVRKIEHSGVLQMGFYTYTFHESH
ncbi:hypothetical protein D3C84_856570 [compost metagenome]